MPIAIPINIYTNNCILLECTMTSAVHTTQQLITASAVEVTDKRDNKSSALQIAVGVIAAVVVVAAILIAVLAYLYQKVTSP